MEYIILSPLSRDPYLYTSDTECDNAITFVLNIIVFPRGSRVSRQADSKFFPVFRDDAAGRLTSGLSSSNFPFAMTRKVEHLIVDAAGFIDRAPLHEYGANLYTVQEVLDEVTDRRQRAGLLALPAALNVVAVYPEHVRFAADFAKKTGDYPSLSATDIKVIALACQVHRREYGADGLRAEPAGKSVVFGRPAAAADQNAVAGFYDPDKLCDAASRLKIDDASRLEEEEVGVHLFA